MQKGLGFIFPVRLAVNSTAKTDFGFRAYGVLASAIAFAGTDGNNIRA